MADRPPQPSKGDSDFVTLHGAIPRMGLNIPVPSGIRPPPAPTSQTQPSGQKPTKSLETTEAGS